MGEGNSGSQGLAPINCPMVMGEGVGGREGGRELSMTAVQVLVKLTGCPSVCLSTSLPLSLSHLDLLDTVLVLH